MLVIGLSKERFCEKYNEGGGVIHPRLLSLAAEQFTARCCLGIHGATYPESAEPLKLPGDISVLDTRGWDATDVTVSFAFCRDGRVYVYPFSRYDDKPEWPEESDDKEDEKEE